MMNQKIVPFVKIQKSNIMSTLGNLIWLVFGGFLVFIEYMVAGFLLCITIVGIPFGLQAFKLAMLALWPFGKTIGYKPSAPGCLSTIMNLIWLLIGGIWIALTHLIFGILLGITIIGIPWAKQHFKLVSLALTPFGREILNK
jgi:uncharacterized membrane protein YccF (DUF307 family)